MIKYNEKIKPLDPLHDPRASFYGKAHTEHTQKEIFLYSYNTLILKYIKKSNKIVFLTTNKNHFTLTTCRHINEFIKQFTHDEHGRSKKELLQMANIKH